MPRRCSKPEAIEDDVSSRSATNTEKVEEDDICPICHLLLYKPIITKCGHFLCEFCLSTWADISLQMQIVELGVDEEDVRLPTSDVVETSCPLCRTQTTASPYEPLELTLKTKYPKTYAEREAAALCEEVEQNKKSLETLILMIGNSHNVVRSYDDDSSAHNKHDWKFFVRPSRTDVIEEVHIHLHPTFRNPHIIVQHPPYHVHRLGWGWFTIYANVILRAGWQWVSAEAEDAPDGGEKGSLPLEWVLDFNGSGSQKRCKVSIRREKEGQECEDTAQQEATRRLWMQQRSQDTDYVDEREVE